MPGHFPGTRIDHLAVKPRAAPSAGHTQQHLRPSCASVPPAPAWMSRNRVVRVHLAAEHAFQLQVPHLGLETLRVALDVAPALSSPSASASRGARGLADALGAPSISPTSLVRRARFAPSSCARAGFDQTAGSSSSRAYFLERCAVVLQEPRN